MRVIHVAPTAFGSGGVYGGGERYPLELARALSRHVDCTLVTFGRVGRDERDEREGRLRLRTVRPIGYLGGHPARPLAPSLPRTLRGADIVHLHHARSPASMWAALWARLHDVPTAVTDHGLQGFGMGPIIRRLYDHFLLVSRYSARELGAPPSRTSIVHAGVDVERYHSDEALSREGVLFVGRLTPHKGIDRLIRALPHGARLTIAGSGGHDLGPPENGYRALLQRLAADTDVRFLGAVPDEQLPELYRRAVVLALPSVDVTCYGKRVAVSELLGLVVLEAMASATPVIASRLGGVPEIVEDGVTGYLVEPGNEAELRDRLATLLADRQLATRMGAEARRRALGEHTWERCAERCLETYGRLLAGSGGAG